MSPLKPERIFWTGALIWILIQILSDLDQTKPDPDPEFAGPGAI